MRPSALLGGLFETLLFQGWRIVLAKSEFLMKLLEIA